MAVLNFKVENHIAHLEMNRPEVMNALNFELNQSLADAWREVEENDDIWVAILSAHPDSRAFSAGMDLKERAEMNAQGIDWRKRRVNGNSNPENVWKPVIAAIHGYCLAGGWMMAQRSDFRICADDAILGIREVKRGLMPHWVADLPRIIGLGNALEVVLMGEYVTPERAREMGFVNSIVPKDEVMDEAYRWANILIENAPLSVRCLKEVLYRTHVLPHDEAMVMAKHLLHRVETSEDIKEGPRAFAEKRKPAWKNR